MFRSATRLTHLLMVLMLAFTFMGVTLVSLQAAPAQASPRLTIFTVSNTNDSGPGSLRQAILDANANTGADVIQITAIGTVALLSPLPAIIDPVTIQGPGAALLRIDGQDLYRVFDIGSVAVTLADLTVQRGQVSGVSDDGAGIRSSGALTLTNVDVLSNTAADDGAGVYGSGPVTLINGLFQNNRSTTGNGGALFSNNSLSVNSTRFVSNTARGDGGAIFALVRLSVTNGLFQANECTAISCDGGALFVFSQAAFSDTSFISNTAQDQGGAVSAPGVVSLTGGLFQGNRSVFGTGGGLFAPGVTDISGTQFRSNMARSNGGGVYANTALTVTHALFQDNQSTHGQGGGLAANGRLTVSDTQFLRNTAQQGGGLQYTLGDGQITNGLFAGNVATTTLGTAILLNSAGRVDLVHLTIAHPTSGSGSAIEVLTGTVGLTNTIIASHTVGINNSGGIVSQDYNLFFANGSNSQGVISGGLNTITGDPAFIDPGGDNYHLGAGSAAIDAGTDAGVTTDFDGELRPQGTGFDIGYDEVPLATGSKLYLPVVTR